MKKIFIADDEEGVRDICRLVLEKEGYAVSEADNGPDTVKKCLQEKPDVLLLDIMLPGFDGYTVQMKLIEDPDARNIPVIVLTAVSPIKSLFDKFPQVKSYLIKPFEPAKVVQAVKEALS